MSRRSRVELSRGKFDALFVHIADGMNEIAERIIETAVVPDAPPLTEGLIASGGTAVWIGSKLANVGKTNQRVGGSEGVSKPRALRLSKTGITAIAGYGARHAHLVELGTVNMPAQPFLGPAAMAVVTSGEVPQILAKHIPKKGDES